MRLSDVMGHAGLAGYAELGLLLFMAAFIAIAIRTLRPGRRAELDALSRLPFDDHEPAGGNSPTTGDQTAKASGRGDRS